MLCTYPISDGRLNVNVNASPRHFQRQERSELSVIALKYNSPVSCRSEWITGAEPGRERGRPESGREGRRVGEGRGWVWG